MKQNKNKLAKALIPLMLLGSPAIAGASSLRSGSRFKAKKSVVESSVKTEKTENKKFTDPFASFGSSKENRSKPIDNKSDVLAFLDNEGLLNSSAVKENIQSGDRKDFAFYSETCVNNARYIWGELYKVVTYTYYNTKNMILYYNNTTHSSINFDVNTTSADKLKAACATAVDDTTAPTFDRSLYVVSKTETQVKIQTNIDEASTVYAVALASGASAPTASEVKLGTGAISTANISLINRGFLEYITLAGLSVGTTYDIYFVAEDDEPTPNIQTTPTKIVVTTDAPANAIPTNTLPTAQCQ